MAEAAFGAGSGHAGLLGIELPGVEVKNEGLLLLPVDPLEPPAGQRIGQQAEIAAAGDREVFSAEAQCGDRDFPNPDLPCRQIVALLPGIAVLHRIAGEAGPVGNSVEIVLHREDTGIVLETGFNQFSKGPVGLPGDRVAGRPVAVHRLATLIFQQGFGAADILPVGGPVLQSDPLMQIAVAGDLVALRSDAFGYLRKALGNPAKDEKSPADGCLGTEFQHPVRVLLYPAFPLRPGIGRRLFFERRDVEVVFNVDC